jgi:hypothetical protein
MILAELRVLDGWVERGEPVDVTQDMVEQLRICGRLVGAPQDLFDEVTSQNFFKVVQLVRQMKKSASNSLGAALLSSRDFEDAGDIRSAIAAFERFIAASSAEGYKVIARTEVARLQRLLGPPGTS